MSLQLHRPRGGALEPSRVESRNWRRSLRSRRWNAPPLENPDAPTTSSKVALLFFVSLAALTFAILVAGYGTGFWAL